MRTLVYTELVRDTRSRSTVARLAGNCASRKPRERYARIQNLYLKNRSRCSKTVLSGDWEKEQASLPLADQVNFWKPLSEAPSKDDVRSPSPSFGACNKVTQPVTASEVEKALVGLKDGSPGPDRITRAQLKRFIRTSLAAHMNLWLWCRCPPSAFRNAITTLVPKSASASAPGDFRPIHNCKTLSSSVGDEIGAFDPCLRDRKRSGGGTDWPTMSGTLATKISPSRSQEITIRSRTSQ